MSLNVEAIKSSVHKVFLSFVVSCLIWKVQTASCINSNFLACGKQNASLLPRPAAPQTRADLIENHFRVTPSSKSVKDMSAQVGEASERGLGDEALHPGRCTTLVCCDAKQTEKDPLILLRFGLARFVVSVLKVGPDRSCSCFPLWACLD